MTREEIAIAIACLLLAIFIAISGLVVIAIAITDFIEARRRRHKAVAAADCAERSRGDQQRSSI